MILLPAVIGLAAPAPDLYAAPSPAQVLPVTETSHFGGSSHTVQPVVRAHFKVNTPEGGERGFILIDGNQLRYRSDVPLTVGRHRVKITRTGYRLDYVELNSEYLPVDGDEVVIDVYATDAQVRIVFFMSKS
jgi:hypothetical protein